MKTKIIQNIKSIILALILVVGVSYVYAAWTNPPANPPSGNTDTPLNVGGAAQTKTGQLQLGNLRFYQGSSVTPGSVLSAVDNQGTVGWQHLRGVGGIYQTGESNNFGLYATAQNSTKPGRTEYCETKNAFTNACSCPSGYTAYNWGRTNESSSDWETNWICILN